METYRATLSFDPELRPLLENSLRELDGVPVEFKGAPSIKHLVESLGVPHTEVGGLRVNGALAGLEVGVQPGDRVEVLAPGDGAGQLALPGEPRFVVDNHLGRLAVYLRMLGFDTLYRNDYQDPELAHTAGSEGRILLTRDRRLLMRREVIYGCCLRSLQPRVQLGEITRRYRLAERARPFRRCLRCNGPLQPVAKADVLDRLQPLTQQYYEEFALCPSCDQVYWKGSHYEHMLELIGGLI